MRITSSMIFHLLSKDYPLVQAGAAAGGQPVTLPRLLPDSPLEPGYLYILDRAEDYPVGESPEGCSFLLLNLPERALPEPPGGCDAAFLSWPAGNKYALMQEVMAVIVRLHEWNAALGEAVKAGFAEIFKVGRQLLDFPLGLVTMSFYWIEHSPDYFDNIPEYSLDDTGHVRLEMINELLLHENFQHLFTKSGGFFFPNLPTKMGGLIYNIFVRGKPDACLLASITRAEHSPGEMQIFENIARYVSETYALHADELMLQKQNDALHLLVASLLNGAAETASDEFPSTLDEYGWKPGHRYSVTVIYFQQQSQLEIEGRYLCQQLESEWTFSCGVPREDSVVWIVNHSLCDTLKRNMSCRQFLVYTIRELICKAGVSDYFDSLADLRSYWAQARHAYRLGQKRNPHFWYFLFTDHLLDYFVERAVSEFSREQLCHKGLLTLLRHDERHHTEYVKTLLSFIENQYSYSITSEKLFVHRTTLTRRLEKIVELTGINFTNARDMLYFQISCLLHR